MFALVLLDLLFIDLALANNDVYFSNGWIPVTRPFGNNQMTTSHIERRHYADGWKPSQSDDESNSNYIRKESIFLSSEAYGTHTSGNILLQNGSVIPYSSKPPSGDNEKTSLIEPNQNHILAKLKPREEMKKTNVNIDTQRRTAKQYGAPSSSDISLTSKDITTDSNTKTTVKQISMIATNVTNNIYEVTEPANIQELDYKSDGVHNEYTNKLVDFLSKYNIKGHEMLNNYARSKQHKKKINRVYHSQDYPVSLIPFRYNSLNHLPVDPVLAVLLSNYGYYLHGFYGLPNSYKNLYGYAASNNIHNNKPFGSYKIYSDTDSSN